VNVLVSSSGRRTGLVTAFRSAVAPSGGRVLTADVDPLAPTHFVGDFAVRVPPVTDPGYADFLLGLVADHDVGLLVPTIDPELPVLAAARDRFAAAGCLAVVSSPGLVDACADKLHLATRLADTGLAYPDTWAGDELPAILPAAVVCKPRRGSASKGLQILTGEEATRLRLGPDVVVQPLIPGPEITVDALFDLAGRPVHAVPRRRLRTLAGESIQGVTIDHEPIREWLVGLLALIGSWGASGPVTIQAILAENAPVLIEVNPRFGGGFPLGHAAGARYPEWLVEFAAGTPVAVGLFDYTVGLHMTRSFQEIFTARPAW
jgi:carbamoyl-phosphate synthase large subunit